MRVGLFVEDAAHAALLVPLLRRIAVEETIEFEFEVRNATGGAPLVLSSLRAYARDLAAGREPFLDVLVVALDSDCASYRTRQKQVMDLLERAAYAGQVCLAVPNPHIERWYLLDPTAVPRVLGASGSTILPQAKCKKDLFKEALRNGFRQFGVTPPAGGIEYGEDIAAIMDLGLACQSPDFQKTITDFRAALRLVQDGGEPSNEGENG